MDEPRTLHCIEIRFKQKSTKDPEEVIGDMISSFITIVVCMYFTHLYCWIGSIAWTYYTLFVQYWWRIYSVSIFGYLEHDDTNIHVQVLWPYPIISLVNIPRIQITRSYASAVCLPFKKLSGSFLKSLKLLHFVNSAW